MNLKELVALCKHYRDLGWAIQEQLHSVVADNMTEDNINPNALGDIEKWLCEAADLAHSNIALIAGVDEALRRCRDYADKM